LITGKEDIQVLMAAFGADYYDIRYIEFWADKLGVSNLLGEVLNV